MARNKYISAACEGLDGIPSPTADCTGRWPGDAALRAAGFQIYARPAHGQAVWIRCRQFFTDEQAHEQLMHEAG